jgi:hypothetical protein
LSGESFFSRKKNFTAYKARQFYAQNTNYPFLSAAFCLRKVGKLSDNGAGARGAVDRAPELHLGDLGSNHGRAKYLK